MGTVASSRRTPDSTVQANCVAGSLLLGSGSGVVPGEGAGTADGSGASGVTTAGDDGAGSGEGEGAASGTDGEAGAMPGDAGVQPTVSSIRMTNTKRNFFIFNLLLRVNCLSCNSSTIVTHAQTMVELFIF